jgi:hypothetical protein
MGLGRRQDFRLPALVFPVGRFPRRGRFPVRSQVFLTVFPRSGLCCDFVLALKRWSAVSFSPGLFVLLENFRSGATARFYPCRQGSQFLLGLRSPRRFWCSPRAQDPVASFPPVRRRFPGRAGCSRSDSLRQGESRAPI